jgi:hypothetical protein
MFRAAVLFGFLCLAACMTRDPIARDGGAPAGDGGAIRADGGLANFDGGPTGPPSIASVDPTSGALEGGTPITLRGQNFAPGAAVGVGDFTADDVVVVSPQEITARTPPGAAPGTVDIRLVNPDGRRAALAQAFTYLPPPPLVIGDCRLEPLGRVSVAPLESFEVRGLVFVDGHTQGPGAAQGLLAQAGYGFPGSPPSTWTWLPATYAGDVDGPTPGDLADDEYRASLALPLASIYRVAFRFSGDGGQSYSYCDLDGLMNGFSESEAATIEVQATSVGFCILQGPAAAQARPNEPSPPFFGRVFIEGVTDAPGEGAGVRAELGVGPMGVSPTRMDWTWTRATYDADAPGPDGSPHGSDEYQATLTVAAPGLYDVAYRFSIDEGAHWVYCDRDGSSNGYSSAQAGALTVAVTADIDGCWYDGPSAENVVLGDSTPPLHGRVVVAGVTDGAGQGAGIRAALGFGPTTAAPSSSAWTWQEALYAGDADGLVAGDLAADVYSAALTPVLPGTFAVVYRFTRDDGQTWAYCDLDGLGNGFDLGQAGRLTVSALSIGDCSLDRPAAATVAPGAGASFYGRVFVAGRTPGMGRGANVVGQVGVGTMGSSPSSWTWTDATYAGDVDGPTPGDLQRDEYLGIVTVGAAGTYRVAFRFSVDGGQSFTLCDLDGASNGFDVGEAASLTVQ